MAVGRRSRWLAGWRLVWVAGVLAALATWALWGAPARGVTLDAQGSGVSAYGGWAAWSRPVAAGGFELVVRSPQGTISIAPVAAKPRPFDVGLGPSAGGVAAVFSVCPDGTCHIERLRLGVAGAEPTTLAIPGGGSDREPAIWNDVVAFVRRNPTGGSDNPQDPGRRPDLLFEWRIGARRVAALTLPTTRAVRQSFAGGGWPAGLTGTIDSLTLRGTEVAYSTTTGAPDNPQFGIMALWLEDERGAPHLVDTTTGGAGNVCLPSFDSPVIRGPWLYAYLRACATSDNEDRFTRYGLDGHGAEVAQHNFLHYLDDELTTVVPDGAGVDWDDFGIQHLARLRWAPIARPVAQTFCGVRAPIC